LKFVANGMMGKISRWLRILGHDVKYENDASDDELLRVAIEESRILLTRDSGLFHRTYAFNVKGVLVEEEKLEEKLANIAHRFKIKLEIDITNSRCPLCGSYLERVVKKQVTNKVPKKSLKRFNDFWLCTSCDKVYWQGTHWKNIIQTLNKAKRLLINKRKMPERKFNDLQINSK
jgi:uncharacterized protein with PIN domain